MNICLSFSHTIVHRCVFCHIWQSIPKATMAFGISESCHQKLNFHSISAEKNAHQYNVVKLVIKLLWNTWEVAHATKKGTTSWNIPMWSLCSPDLPYHLNLALGMDNWKWVALSIFCTSLPKLADRHLGSRGNIQMGTVYISLLIM